MVAMLPFIGAWRFSAIGIDDPQYYLLTPEVTQGLSWAGLKWAFTDLSNAIWMPLTWLVYQADYSIRDLLATIFPVTDGYQLAYSIAHIQSVLLNGLNAALLFYFLRLVANCDRLTLPFLASLLWAVHPLRVESVIWIASLKDVLSMTFLLAALVSWVRYRRQSDRRSCVYSHIAFAFACCAKPSVITFPGMIFLLDAMLGKMPPLTLDWRRYKDYLPSMAMAIPVAFLAQIAQSAGGATTYQADIPLWYRLWNAIVSIGVYVRNFTWPSQLAPQCAIQWPGPPHMALVGSIIGGLVVLAGIVLAVLLFIRIQRNQSPVTSCVTVGALWALGTLMPMLGISAFGGHAFADRFTYIPFIGLSMALLSLERLHNRIARGTCCSILAATIAAYGSVAHVQTRYWQDDGKLMPRILEVDGDNNFLAHVCYAKHLCEHDHSAQTLETAERHFTAGYGLNPQWCMSSSLSYMFILGETGKIDRLPEVQNNFIKWLREKHHMWKSMDQDISEGIIELFGNGCSEPKLEKAHMTAAALLASGRKDVPQVFYLAYLVGKATGDADMAAQAIDGLRKISDFRTGYDNPYRFRFVLNEKGANK